MLPNYFNLNFRFKKFIRDFVVLIASKLLLRSATRKLRKVWVGAPEHIDLNVIVVANGPSFSDELIKFIVHNRDTYNIISMNFFYQNRCALDIVPDYYIISDPMFLLDENRIPLLNYLRKNSKIKLVIPANKIWLKVYEGDLYFDDAEALFTSNISPELPRGYTGNTGIKAIAIALKLKFKKIYLFGFDFNYPNNIFLSDKNKLMFKYSHHYGSKIVDYSEVFEGVAHALNWWSVDYYNLKKLSNSKIINVTNSSLIDAFERCSIEKFLEESNFVS